MISKKSCFFLITVWFYLSFFNSLSFASEFDITADMPATGNECQQHLHNSHLKPLSVRNGFPQSEFEKFQSLAEQSLRYRAETIKVAERLQQDISQGKPLSGADLNLLNAGTVAHLALREALFEIAEAHECWLDVEPSQWQRWGISDVEVFSGVMLSLSAALILYDNYLLAVSIYEDNDKLRRFLNARDEGYNKQKAQLAAVTLSYNSIANRQRVRAAIRYYESQVGHFVQQIAADPRMTYLNELITQSPSYNRTKEYAPITVLNNKLKFVDDMSSDFLNEVGREGANLFSMLFGNTVGLIETRKGKLYGSQSAYQDISEQLGAGDILLEKTPFRLTDSFIPGHWGHAAIWIGTEQELKDLGIWENDVVKPYHEEIRGGNLVVEALRSGVEMNPLQHFLNVDDLAVIRDTNLDDEGRSKVIIQALRQVGKPYDFNFDIETTDMIVCSELVYVSYIDETWPTERNLGRETISPDNIAVKSVTEPGFQVLTLYHDGKPMPGDTQTSMQTLLEMAGDQFSSVTR